MASAPWKRAEVWVPLLAACAFLPSLRAGFVYDDLRLIVENAYVQAPDHWARAFSTHFWDISGAPPASELLRLYRPLVTLSYLSNWLLGSGQAWTFHLTNVLLHVLNTWLVLVIGLRLTRGAKIPPEVARPLAILAASFFALHPTRAEAVAWVSGRPDPLMTAFVLLTMQLVYWGRQRGARPAAVLGAAVAFCGALCSKEPALATPILLLADTADARGPERRWHFSMVILTATLGAGYLVLRHWLLPVGSPPLAWTPAEALVTIGNYAERAVFPWPLTFFYDLEHAAGTAARPSGWDLGLGTLVVLGTVAWSASRWRRDQPTFWLIASAVAFLGPLLNLTETGARTMTSDRYLYLPLWLVAIAGCRSAPGSLAPIWRFRMVRLGAALVLVACGAASCTRSLDFLDERSLWQSELEVHAHNPVALRAVAALQVRSGDPEGAMQNLERSLQARALSYRGIVTQAENADSYGKLVALKATKVPDGSTPALGALLQDGVDRLAGKLPAVRGRALPIEWPLDDESARWVSLHSEEGLARHLVGLSTRLNVHEVSMTLLDAISDEQLHLAPNPLLIALADAREQRFERALRRVAVMRRERALMPKVVTDPALVDCEARVSTARDLFASAQTLATDEAGLARARGFANLGAYYRALLEIQRVDPREPGMLPLYVQLLVSARLEKAALQVASQALGSERANATIDTIRAQLPPDLLALPPVDLASDVSSPDPL